MRKLVTIGILLFTAISAFAQQQDAVLTGGISVEKKITKSFSATFFTQHALNENISELGYSLYDGGIGFRMTRQWSIEGHYRFANVRSTENVYEPRQYVYGDLQYVKSIGDFSAVIRGRYLVKTYGFYLNDDNQYRDNKHYIRTRAQVKYDLGPHSDFFVAAEQVYRLDTKNETEQIRYAGGYNYTFNLHHRLQFQYTIAPRYNTSHPDTDFISGVTYYFKF